MPRGFDSLVMLTVWKLWLQRNDMVFNGKAESATTVIKNITEEARCGADRRMIAEQVAAGRRARHFRQVDRRSLRPVSPRRSRTTSIAGPPHQRHQLRRRLMSRVATTTKRPPIRSSQDSHGGWTRFFLLPRHLLAHSATVVSVSTLCFILIQTPLMDRMRRQSARHACIYPRSAWNTTTSRRCGHIHAHFRRRPDQEDERTVST
ncbi:hypothetical protein C2845_PM05G03870 [Panicum miliaceum]|uniref:Uncharacterized protein n=1 Tax=Panicum miliaceum TaxID=4540 RepID=A0A3L6T0I8_PANMI|nr:hypothetical protein C2845_PM05G03870 [Panicum miliaceum]